MPKQTSKSKTNANLNRPKPIPPGEQEISDMRDDAAQAAGTRTDPDRQKYAEGVRDALAWVIGELEMPWRWLTTKLRIGKETMENHKKPERKSGARLAAKIEKEIGQIVTGPTEINRGYWAYRLPTCSGGASS